VGVAVRADRLHETEARVGRQLVNRIGVQLRLAPLERRGVDAREGKVVNDQRIERVGVAARLALPVLDGLCGVARDAATERGGARIGVESLRRLCVESRDIPAHSTSRLNATGFRAR
jgi:hypothetical protein